MQHKQDTAPPPAIPMPPIVVAFGRITLWLFIAFTGAHALSMWGILFAHEFIGESVQAVRLFNELIHVGVLPALVLIPVCLLLRRWLLVGLLLPVALVALVWYVPYFLPKTAPVLAEDSPRLTVMTFNVWAGNREFDELIAVVRNSGAEIIAFQEISQPIYEALAPAVVDLYPEQACNPANEKCIMSIYLIEESEYWRIRFSWQQRALIRVDGRLLAVYNVHPANLLAADAFARRDEDIAEILRRIDAEADEVSVILMGDFNANDRTGIYRRLADRFNDVWIELGQGLGFTHSIAGVLPRLSRLDYIFYGDDLVAQQVRVLPEHGGSDHHPLWAEFGWPQGD